MTRRRARAPEPAWPRLAAPAGLLAVAVLVGVLLVPLEAGRSARTQAVVHAGVTIVSPAARPVVLAAAGPQELPHPPTGRRRGLPVAVAVVALLGAASLVVRVLLAVPVRRRR